MDVQQVINAAMAANATTLGTGEASKIFREGYNNSIKVHVTLKHDEINWLKKNTSFPLVFIGDKVVTHDHQLLCAMREVTRDAFEKSFKVSSTKVRTLMIGASQREITKYSSNPYIHYYVYGKENKDYDRAVRPALEEIVASLSSKAAKTNYNVNLPPPNSMDTTALRPVVKRYYQMQQIYNDYMLLHKLPSTIHLNPIEADVLVFEDSIYNFNEDTLTKLFLETNANIAYGYGLFPMELLFPDMPPNRIYHYSTYKCRDLCVHMKAKFGTDNSESDEYYCTQCGFGSLRARLTFRSGFSNGYEHDYFCWKTLLNKPAFTANGISLAVEITSRIGCMMSFKIYRCKHPEAIVRTIELNEYEKYVKVLDAWASVDHRTCRMKKKLVYFAMREREFFEIWDYTMGLEPKSVTVQNTVTQIRRKMGGIYAAGRDASEKWELNMSQVYPLATAIYMQAKLMIEKTESIVQKSNPTGIFEELKKLIRTVGYYASYPLQKLFELLFHEHLTDRIILFPEDGCLHQRSVVVPELPSSETFSSNLVLDNPNTEDIPTCPFCAMLQGQIGVQRMICSHQITSDVDWVMDDKDIADLENRLIDNDLDPEGIKKVKERAKEAMPKTGFKYTCRVEYLCGPPGTGKSYIARLIGEPTDTLMFAPFTNLRGDYVNADFQGGKITFDFATNHRAVASSGHRAIIVDEFTSVDYALLACTVWNNKPDIVYLVGDIKQTKIREPNEGLYIPNHIPNFDKLSKHELTVNFRNAVDVVALLNREYGYTMIPACLLDPKIEKVERSIFKELTSVEMKLPASTRMAFTKLSAKTNIEDPKHTVRAYQGKTVKVAEVFATALDKDLPMIDELAIVALSRHTQALYIRYHECEESLKFLSKIHLTTEEEYEEFLKTMYDYIPSPEEKSEVRSIDHPDVRKVLEPVIKTIPILAEATIDKIEEHSYIQMEEIPSECSSTTDECIIDIAPEVAEPAVLAMEEGDDFMEVDLNSSKSEEETVSPRVDIKDLKKRGLNTIDPRELDMELYREYRNCVLDRYIVREKARLQAYELAHPFRFPGVIQNQIMSLSANGLRKLKEIIYSRHGTQTRNYTMSTTLMNYTNELLEAKISDNLLYARLAFVTPKVYNDDPLPRIKSRFADLQKLIGNHPVKSYLDVGTMDGEIARYISDYYAVNDKMFYQSDLEDVRENKIGVYIDASNIVNYKVIPDRSLDLVTLFMSAHHIADMDTLLEVLLLKLHPQGKLVIREHDVDGKDEFSVVLNAYHGFSHLVWTKEGIADLKHVYGTYYTKTQWIEYFQSFGFNVKTADTNDKFRSFYALMEVKHDGKEEVEDEPLEEYADDDYYDDVDYEEPKEPQYRPKVSNNNNNAGNGSTGSGGKAPNETVDRTLENRSSYIPQNELPGSVNEYVNSPVGDNYQRKFENLKVDNLIKFEEYKEHLQEMVPYPLMDTKLIKPFVDPNEKNPSIDAPSLPHPGMDAYLYVKEPFDIKMVNPDLAANNEVDSSVVIGTFRDTETSLDDLTMQINQRGHPQRLEDKFMCIGNGRGTRFTSSNPYQELNVMGQRYNNPKPARVFDEEARKFARELVDLYYAECKVMNYQLTWDEAELARILCEFLDAASTKHYYQQFGGYDREAVARMIRFHLKTIYKPANTMKEADPYKAGQGISAWNPDLLIFFCFAWRYLADHDRRTERNDEHTSVFTDNGMNIQDFLEKLRMKMKLFGDLPIKQGILDQEMFDSFQNEWTQYLEQYYWSKMGVSDEFLEMYYQFRHHALMIGRYSSCTITYEKTSGEPGTLVNNGVIEKVIGNALIRGQGPMVAVYKGDDYNKQQMDLHVDEDVMAKIKLFTAMKLRVHISNNGEFCGYILAGNEILPNIVRKFDKIVAKPFKNYKQFAEYQESLRDFALEIRAATYNKCIEGAVRQYDLSIVEAEKILDCIISMGHINEEQWNSIVHEVTWEVGIPRYSETSAYNTAVVF